MSAAIWALVLGGAWAEMPGLPEAPAPALFEVSLRALGTLPSTRPDWIVKPLPAMPGMPVGPSPDSARRVTLRKAYQHRQSLDLVLRPMGPRHAWVLQWPMHYTYWEVPGQGLSDNWTSGDARLFWQVEAFRSETWMLQALAGTVMPTATQAVDPDWAYALNDLEGLPRGRHLAPGEGAAGATGFRLLAGLRIDGTWPWNEARHSHGLAQVDIRQPWATDSTRPFTLFDMRVQWDMPLGEHAALRLAAGQTRGGLPPRIFALDVPSASWVEAGLVKSGTAGLRFGMGLRFNPLASDEAESYTAVRPTALGPLAVQMKMAVEPPWQVRFEVGYALARESSPRRISSETLPSPRPVLPLDRDHDQDGVADGEDECSGAAEDRDGFQDADGCPDADNDRDGIADAPDLCPNDAEDVDGFQDADGCPDLDNDRDGLPDTQDLCPMQRETVNFYQDGDGCSDEKPDRVSRKDLDGLTFAPNRETLDSAGLALVVQLAAKLKIYPGTELFLYGHADPTENEAKALGHKRARTVARELQALGIAADRLKVESRGSDEPAGNVRTAKGRAQSRRVTLEPH